MNSDNIQYEKFFSVSLDLLCLAGFDGFFKRLNPRWTAVLGWTEEELLSRPFIEFVHPEDRESTLAEAAKLAEGDHVTVYFENRYAMRDGSYRWLRWTANASLSDSLLYAIATDITELKLKNLELDHFAYVVSHDLKSPLRGMQSLAQWVVEDEENQLTEDSREYLAMLGQRGEMLSNLIDGVLQYSRVGRVDIAVKKVDVGALVQAVWDSLSKEEDAVLSGVDTLPVLVTGEVPLQQVVQNLLSNAVRYGATEGLKVMASHRLLPGGLHEFAVEDNGEGISEKYREKIFLLFQTLQAKDVDDSTGVGLAVVEKLVRSHGGEVRVEDGALGGARFVFTWRAETAD